MAYIRLKSNRKGKKVYEYTVSLGKDPATGKYKSEIKSGFTTKTEAKLAAEEVERQLREGTYIREQKKTFQQVYEDWMKHYEKRSKISSVRARSIAAKRLLEKWEYYPISKITSIMYQQHLDELSDQFSLNYLDSIHSTGRMIFNFAERNSLINRNPTEHYEKPKKVQNEVVEKDLVESFLELDELESFLMLAKEEGLKHDLEIFTMLAYVGMRSGELLSLKTTDIDFATKILSINKTLYNPNNNKKAYQLIPPKNKGSIRLIELDDYLIQLLKQRVVEMKKEKLKAGANYHNQDFIFSNELGYPYTFKHLAIRLIRLMKKMKEQHGLKKHITPHSFRHTNISLLIEAGVQLSEIQRRVGHEDYQTTMNIYTHVTKKTMVQASDMFSAHLANVTKKLQNK